MPEPGEGEVRRESGRRVSRRADLGKVLDEVLGAAPASAAAKTLSNSVGMAFVLVPAGKFLMGSPPDEVGHRANEGPVHEVVVGNAFYLGVHLVTQAVYLAVTGKNPARFSAADGGGPEHPVESVSWDDAVAFGKRLSERPEERLAGRSYRLPTEAEWEYAARAGTDAPFAFGGTFAASHGNFDAAYPYGEGEPGASAGRTTPAPHYPATAWGCTTRTATSGNGVPTGTPRRTIRHCRCATRRGRPTAGSACCAAGVGATTRPRAGPRTATHSPRTSAIRPPGSVSSSSPPRDPPPRPRVAPARPHRHQVKETLAYEKREVLPTMAVR